MCNFNSIIFNNCDHDAGVNLNKPELFMKLYCLMYLCFWCDKETYKCNQCKKYNINVIK